MRSTLVAPALLALLACSSSQPEQPEQPADSAAPVVEPDEGKPVTPGEVKLSPFDQTVTVPVGTKLLWSFESHGSVGLGAVQRVEDPAVVKYLQTDMEYEQSAEEREGKTGADAATGTFVFEAVAAGTTTVTLEKQFRGETQESFSVTVIVGEK